jgi:predicted Fe-Mo cluster-binding NifX family protein
LRELIKMKIVIPTDNKKGLDDKIAEHFGRCRTYTFLNKEGKIIKIIDNKSLHMGGAGLPPEFLKEEGADVLLCKEIGPRAISLCKDLEIDVYVYKAKTVREIFEMWKDNKIKKAGSEDACESHKI